MVDMLDADDIYDLGDIAPYRIFRRNDVDETLPSIHSSIGSLDLWWTDRGGFLRLVAIGSYLPIEQLVIELWGAEPPESSDDGHVRQLTPTRVDPEIATRLLAASYRVRAADESIGLYGAAAASSVRSLADLLERRIDDSDGGIGQLFEDLRESADDLAADAMSAFMGLPMALSARFPDQVRRTIFEIADDLKSQLDDFGVRSVERFITRSIEGEIDDLLESINQVVGLALEPVAPIRGVGQPVVDVDPRFAEFGLGLGDVATALVDGSEEELIEVVLEVHDSVRTRAVDVARRWMTAVRVMIDPGSDDGTIEAALRALRLAHYRLNAAVVLGVSTDVLEKRSADDIEQSLRKQLKKRNRAKNGGGSAKPLEIEPPVMLPVVWCEETDPTNVGGHDIGSNDADPDRAPRWRVRMVPPALIDPSGTMSLDTDDPTGPLPVADTSGYVARLALVGRPGRIRVSLDSDPGPTAMGSDGEVDRLPSLASLRRVVNRTIRQNDAESGNVDEAADVIGAAAVWLALSRDPDRRYGDAEHCYRELVGDDPVMTTMAEELATAMFDPKVEGRRDQLRRLRNGASSEVDKCVPSSDPGEVADEQQRRADDAVNIIRRIDRFIYGERRRGVNRP